MATTEDEIKELERRISEEGFGEGNLDLLDEYVAAEYIGHNPGAQEDIRGRAELKEFVRMFRSAFPDLDVTVEIKSPKATRSSSGIASRVPTKANSWAFNPRGSQ